MASRENVTWHSPTVREPGKGSAGVLLGGSVKLALRNADVLNNTAVEETGTAGCSSGAEDGVSHKG